MSTTPTEQPVDLACLHCSPLRTVWRRRAVDSRADEVHKVYASGAPADAEHEAAMGVLAAGPGVVPHLGAGVDDATGRPCVRQTFVEGEDLESTVLRIGAVPAKTALRLAMGVAETLTRLHGLRQPTAPRGLCHGDIKPQNILATTSGDVLLLDFEHAGPIGAPSEGRSFTGGTVAWSPPEALRGAPPDASFDVFGLGATLAFLLDGDTARRVPQHADVEALIAACCDASAAQRPDASVVVARCAELIESLRDDAAERHLDDWATGTFESPPSPSNDRRSTMWRRRRRLLQRLPQLLRRPESLPDDAAALRANLEDVARTLRRFPRSRAALEHRRELLSAASALLLDVGETVQAHHRQERFDRAAESLQQTESLVSTAAAIPGGLAAIGAPQRGQIPSVLHRSPLEFLRILRENNEAARERLSERKDAIAAACRQMDMARAEQLLEALANEYGGTSPTVAEQRDDLHRFAFYLDRVARAAPNVERVTPLWDAQRLRSLSEFVTAAGEAQALREGGGAVGLRSLQLTLGNVVEEFPAMEQVPPVLAALREALVDLTDGAWRQLADAEQRLTVVPVPVRPLQLALGRLDSLRVLEALVDRPEQPRSALIDGIERLRLGLERARSTRDRLTENAEHALARGHWTTGLFEMERAVEGMAASGEGDQVEAERLRERLHAARRTKQELESAVRRNAELNAQYLAQEEDAHSTTEARLRTLQERRDCLMFLGMHAQAERADLYRQDLRQVETQIALERAADAERRLNALSDHAMKLRLARETLEALGVNESGEGDSERSGRVVRLQEHWRSIACKCQDSIDAEQRLDAQRRRERRRIVAMTVLLVIAAMTAVGFAVRPWLFNTPFAASDR